MVKMTNVSVTTPECCLDFKLENNSTGRRLIRQVCSTVNLREENYFGLRYVDENMQYKWVKLNKKMSAIIKTKNKPVTFELRVKFFPEEVTEELIQEVAQKYFYAQVRNDILSGDIYCPPATALLLASYQAHIQLGPYDEAIHKPGFLTISGYLPKRMLSQFDCSDQDWEDKIVSWYKKHTDIFIEDAIVEYLKIAQDLEMYGVTYFKIRNKKGRELWLGVDSIGMNIYPLQNQLTPEIGFPWSEIKNLSYRDSKFFVKPMDSSAEALQFLTESSRLSKEILALCLGNHDLYRVRRNPDSIERQQMKAQAKESKALRERKRAELRAERRAREQLEQRVLEHERALEQSKDLLSSYQSKIVDLEDQNTRERNARLELEQKQFQLEELARQMNQRESKSSEELERIRLEHEKTMREIQESQDRLAEEEAIRQAAESKLAQLTAQREQEMAERVEHELEKVNSVDDQPDREAMATVDVNYASRLNQVNAELNLIRDSSKLELVDQQYEVNTRRGMDKYRTLRAIRMGNTKKRVDQFEAM